ncbi:hypothetical protein HCTV5_59 [Halovirus HCTV-5]|uniref:hypothetical protein n=1 Tax=Halovirus HCTV-5 TaxID=1273748 RepID=UPI00033486D8|nr:hypothetical protein M200_gp166 [Halovirus HCTV-5]AGM11668.1 hypothetical protein HCTV5_59 [Halovirus HCTV-5]
MSDDNDTPTVQEMNQLIDIRVGRWKLQFGRVVREGPIEDFIGGSEEENEEERT